MNSNGAEVEVSRLPICRTCLQTDVDLASLYDSKAAEMLNDCHFCTVLENDDLPEHICLPCLQTLQHCYSFKKMCKESESTLKKGLEEKKSNDQLSVNSNKASEPEYSMNFSNLKDEIPKNDSSVYLDPLKADENTLDLSEDEESSLKEDFISFLDQPLPPPLRFKCQNCDHSFNEENDLQVHQSIHTPDLTCLACFKKFTGRQALIRHLKIHFIEKPHVCKTCGKSFSESYGLVKHLRRHSGIPREKKYSCEECGQGFSEPYYLKVHMRKHTGERPFTCPHCQKSFADPRCYKTHIMNVKIHAEQEPFKCNYCLKRFKQIANLKKHLQTHDLPFHDREKQLLCETCDKKFSQPSNLKNHLKVHLERKIFVCDKCNKKYLEEAAFTKHKCKKQRA